MNFIEKITIELLGVYFVAAAVIIFVLWKSLPPFLVYLDTRSKNKKEALKLEKTESAEFRKAELEYEIKLEELTDQRIKLILDTLQEEIDQLKGDKIALEGKVKACQDAENDRKQIYLKKLFMLREYQRELRLMEVEVLKLGDKPEFQKIALVSISFLKSQAEEHEKLLT